MRFQSFYIWAFLVLSTLSVALPTQGFDDPDEASSGLKDKVSYITRDGVPLTVFEHAATGVTLEFVTNSGICETTPGVNQYSGYISVGTNESFFFWFFEARNNASTAPLATWFNGGPGCSSMIGLFQENGPCNFQDGATEPSLNPYSWNEYANMLYIDQPVGAGFSFGNSNTASTVTAATFVWSFIQAWYAQFPQYENRNFGLFTESYGGHYGPEFASYFAQQNHYIDDGLIIGIKINLVALGINNGWYDAILQYKAYIDYSLNNTYRQLISQTVHDQYINTYTSTCLPLLQSCPAITGTNGQCVAATNACSSNIETPLSNSADFDVYDIRQPSDDPYPPSTYMSYLQQPFVMTAIGAKSTYVECSDPVFNAFATTGDDARSFLATLSNVVQSGLTTLIWAGDADWQCNWFGGLAAANAITYAGSSQFLNTPVSNYTVGGTAAGTFKTVRNLSWLRVFAAGHEVPYYQPALALQVFIQTMQRQPISST